MQLLTSLRLSEMRPIYQFNVNLVLCSVHIAKAMKMYFQKESNTTQTTQFFLLKMSLTHDNRFDFLPRAPQKW